jgi:uncharacterized membrane protein HdeD (DUF308 family)
MLAELAKNWWLFLARGLLAILFAIAAFAWPGFTLLLLLWMFGIYCLVDGFTSIVLGVKSEQKLWPIVGGLVSIAAGFIVVLRPGLGAVAVVLVIGIWAVAHGVADIVMAIRIRREVKGEWALALAGIVQIALGVMLIMRPGSGAVALLWLIGTFLLLMGLLLVALALRLRRLGKEMGEATPAAA